MSRLSDEVLKNKTEEFKSLRTGETLEDILIEALQRFVKQTAEY